MDSVNLEQLRADLHSSDGLTCYRAIRSVIAVIPQAESLLPDLFAIFRRYGSDPRGDGAYVAIWRHESHAIPFLFRVLESADARDRIDAIHLLLRLGHNRSSWRLAFQVLDDRPPSQPQWDSHRNEVIDRLILALYDHDPDVQVVAAVSLDDIGHALPDLVNRLVKGLSSSDTYFQNLAALHLGRLGPTALAALPALQTFVESHVDSRGDTRRPVLAAKNAIILINGGSPKRGP